MRHPRPQVADGVCYGRSDLPLAEDVAACAERLRSVLPAGAPVFSSPLARCRRLAEALHRAPVFDARLAEADFGRWEMQAWDAIDRAALDAWAADPLHYAGHGGESVAALQARAVECAEEIAARHEEAILVVHAGVMKALVAAFAGVPAPDWFGFGFAHGTASLIEDGRLAWHNEPAAAGLSPGEARPVGHPQGWHNR